MTIPFALLWLGLACKDDAVTPPDDSSTPHVPTFCESLGLSERAWQEAEDERSLYAIAADVEIPTLAGDFELAASWTGCEVYMFVQEDPRQASASDWSRPLFARDVESLFDRSPRNVHWFFIPSSEDTEAAFEDLQPDIDELLSDMDDEDRAWWETRIHYVDEQDSDLDGWLGDNMRTPNWGVAIDRFQRIRYIGSYADPERYSNSAGWFEPNLSMAANEAIYYNFEAEREDRLALTNATIVNIFPGVTISDPSWAGERGYAEVTLPDAATMATFDTMELDLYLGCEGDGEYGDCPAWDYLVYLHLCEVDEPDTCSKEIGRWITTYHREGRWVHDVSGLLPLLAEGGTRRFSFYTQQPYAVNLNLRLSNQGKPNRPSEVVYLWGGGGFDASYNANHAPQSVAIPVDAAKVELATVISGHGQVSPGNCAEFCDTTHNFIVNGTTNTRSFPEAGSGYDCQDKVAEGTVPNQYGTWWYGRSGWCPGKEVPMVTFDLSSQLTPGSTETLSYEAWRNGETYPGGGAWIDLSAWLVIYR